MATSVSLMPGITPEDKLRLAASKGQLDKVKEFISSGISFEPDRVSKLHRIQTSCWERSAHDDMCVPLLQNVVGVCVCVCVVCVCVKCGRDVYS